MKTNYYDILGVERSASESEIRIRFRQLARDQHPDRYTGSDKEKAEARFQALTQALNVLTNPARRRQHDQELTGGVTANTNDPSQVARAYVSIGIKAYKEGNFPGARDNFDMAVKHNPAEGKAWYYLALAAARIPSAGRQAVQAIETAVQKEPYNPTYLKDAGLLCKRAGLSAKAERYLEEALQWDADNQEVRAALNELRQGKDVKEPGRGLLDSLFKKG
jgi:curved DNA-binding protein CbpA